MRFDSCRQCIRRRIQCDAADPECQKCRKKGIACSGVGKKYRFVEYRTARGVPKTTAPRRSATANHRKQQGVLSHSRSNPHNSLIPQDDTETIGEAAEEVLDIIPASSAVSAAREHASSLAESTGMALAKAIPLEVLDPKLRMLFDHFSSTIAPAMVVIDQNFNGYRNILLPLATYDPLVQRAVSVVAALHLGKKRPDLLGAAERGRSAIIERLRRDALLGQQENIFNLSTWATIILLLVGETVTGDQEFVHLFPMLNSLLECKNNISDISPQTARFLWQQSQMFNLFTPPFLDPAVGVTALQQRLERYLDFLSYPTDDPNLSAALDTIKTAIYLARDLYLKETRCELSAADRWQAVENIRALVLPIQEDTPGMHALVWTYFIAAASSSDSSHRQFFLERLRQIYEKTNMRNIVATIDLLEHSVWRLPECQNWITSPAILNRVLIM